MKKIITDIRKDKTIDFFEFEDLILSDGDENFKKYYRLYEYTDDLTVLSDDTKYPGILNFVKTGILTKEEMIDALFYNKKER